ncbi:MAG TPA: alpha-hydroxy acid oxidase [Gemmatimonadales bacterium]|nr:alpha-hydroxy acid oxidase [Gemmatimonadales bacterium]
MEPVNLLDYENLARERLDAGVYGYVAGGATDEITLVDNVAAFRRMRLLPRVLVDVGTVDAGVTVLGQPISAPILLAPTAFQSLVHPDGELAVARAAAAVRTIMVVSTMSAYRMEEVAAAAAGPKWFQLYCYRDREVTRALVQRAEAAGYGAVCLTVDLPRVGRRERDLRSGFRLPATVQPRNFEGLLDLRAVAGRAQGFAEYIHSLVDASLTWDAVDWLRSVTRLPVVLKGILTPADAVLAVEHGARGIVVSNHGARQLDTVPATIDVLAGIADAVAGRVDLLMDGGVRRGTDVAKALALGAKAVLVGRPYLYGLAAGGEAGATRVLELLKGETELALALLGCASSAAVTRAHVTTPLGAVAHP